MVIDMGWQDEFAANIPGLGAFSLGMVVGWLTYRTLRLRKEPTALSDIGLILGTILGAAVTTALQSELVFGAYCIGLPVGFFAYLLTWMKTGGRVPFMGR